MSCCHSCQRPTKVHAKNLEQGQASRGMVPADSANICNMPRLGVFSQHTQATHQRNKRPRSLPATHALVPRAPSTWTVQLVEPKTYATSFAASSFLSPGQCS